MPFERRASPHKAADSETGKTKKRPSQGLYVSVTATRVNTPSGASAQTRLGAAIDLRRANERAAMPVVVTRSSPAGPYHEAVSLAVVGELVVESPVARKPFG